MRHNSDMMFRLAEIEIDPAQAEAYCALLTEEIEQSLLLEPGVLFLQACAEKEKPSQIRVFECYANVQAYQSHIASPHFLKYKHGTQDMVKSLRLIELDPLALAAKRQIWENERA